ncbi:hypothetical protein ES703_45935 [subsurface metagenome]
MVIKEVGPKKAEIILTDDETFEILNALGFHSPNLEKIEITDLEKSFIELYAQFVKEGIVIIRNGQLIYSTKKP